MRTFVIRARKATTQWNKLSAQIGSDAHFEVVLHCVMQAFFLSNDFRDAVDIYIIHESTDRYPCTLHLSSQEGLSLPGFHEQAIVEIFIKSLQQYPSLQKDTILKIAPGLELIGCGFDKLINTYLYQRPLYLLDKKGEDIRSAPIVPNPVFILSDHLAMPKNSIKGLKRHSINSISLGKRMLFASQCMVLIQDELDRRGVM